MTTFTGVKAHTNHFDSYGQGFGFVEDSAIFMPRVKHRMWTNCTKVVAMSTDKSKSRERLWPIARADFIQLTKVTY